jgi:hypothetical protein
MMPKETDLERVLELLDAYGLLQRLSDIRVGNISFTLYPEPTQETSAPTTQEPPPPFQPQSNPEYFDIQTEVKPSASSLITVDGVSYDPEILF